MPLEKMRASEDASVREIIQEMKERQVPHTLIFAELDAKFIMRIEFNVWSMERMKTESDALIGSLNEWQIHIEEANSGP